MARLDEGLGYVPRPDEVTIQNGQLNPFSVRNLRDQVDRLTAAFNGKISLGNGDSSSQAGNLDLVFAKAVTPASANTEFTVRHELGRIPVGFLPVSIDKAGIVYASRKGSWTKTSIFLKCSAATASITVLLL